MQVATTQTSSLSTLEQKFTSQEVPNFSTPNLLSSENYLKVVFESFLGQFFPSQGLLLLNQAGQLVQSNAMAREICRSVVDRASHQIVQGHGDIGPVVLPTQVTELLTFLIDGHQEFPGKALQLSEDVFCGNGVRIHLTAEWIDIEGQSTPYILVRLEDTTQIAGQRALLDACRYGFTPRETEVWALYLQGFSYRQMSEELFIAMSTVKKHMKSISAKRRFEIY